MLTHEVLAIQIIKSLVSTGQIIEFSIQYLLNISHTCTPRDVGTKPFIFLISDKPCFNSYFRDYFPKFIFITFTNFI